MLGRTLTIALLAALLVGSTGCHRKGMFRRHHGPCCTPCCDVGGYAPDCGCTSFYPAPPTATEVPSGPMPPVPVGHFTPTR